MISQSVTCQIQKIWDRPNANLRWKANAWNFLWENVAWSMLKPISGQRVATGFIPLQPLHVLRSQSHLKKSSGFHMYRDWHKAIHWFQGPCTWARTWEVFPFDSRHSSCREKQSQAGDVRNCWFVHEKIWWMLLVELCSIMQLWCSYGAALIWSFPCFSNVDVPLKVPKFWPKPRDIWVLLRSACRGRRTLSR